jgi:hypothetical protein
MAADQRSRNRIYLDVPEDVYARAYHFIPWGWRNQLMTIILDQLLLAIEYEGLEVAALIISGKLRLFGRSDGND